jgi:predicted Zn-dependent peptidase
VTKSAVVLALLAACATGAAAAEAPPLPGEPHEFRLPAKETFRLDNGLEVTFVDYGNVPKATILAVVRTGNIDEGENTWLPDVAVEMLKEGTTKRSAADIALAAAGMGGELGVAVSAEQTTIGISVLSEHAADAVALVADVLRNPAFPESELPRVIANFERNLAVARSDPLTLADEALARLVFGDHPFGRTLPREGQIAGYDIAKIRDFYVRNFGAVRTHLFVAGQYDRGGLEQAIRAAFGSWPAGEPPSSFAPRAREKLTLELVDVPGAAQSSVRIAVPVPGPADTQYFQTTLMNSVLGGTFGSRITSNIREDKGYSYSPGSSIQAHRGVALWVMSAEITTEHTAAALSEIFREIERLRAEAPQESELAPVKAYRAGVFVVQNASPNGVLRQLAFMDLHGLPDDFLTRWVESIHAVTPAEVTAIAREYLPPSRMTVVVAGDLDKIGASVRALPQFARASMP